MLTRIKISGFKTFVGFEMEFSPLTIIAGINASGKSNLFDALQLISSMAEMDDLRKAFKEQRGEPIELFTQFEEDKYVGEMEFELDLLVNKQVRDNWGEKADLKYTRLRYKLKIQRRNNERGLEDLFVVDESLEPIRHNDDKWIKKFVPATTRDYWRPKVATGKRGIPYIYTETARGDVPTFIVPQDGRAGNKREFSAAVATRTTISAFSTVEFPHIFAVREEMRSWKFLQLSPQILKEPTRQDVGVSDRITQSGGNLAAAMYRIKLETPFALKDISRRLNNLLPSLTEVKVIDDKANKQFVIKVRGEDGREFSSRVLSEGTLRLLALLLFLYDNQHRDLLCFEEPENGIHPFRLKAMADLLKDLSVDFSDVESTLRQVIVNTHSPILLAEIFKLEPNNNIGIWFAQLISRISEVNGQKIKLHISNIRPVEMGQNGSQLMIPYSEHDRKVTLTDAIDYLKSADVESTIKTLIS